MTKTIPQKAEIKIVVAQHLLPIEGEVLSPGAIAFQGENILQIGSPDELKSKYPGATIQEYPHQTVLPGLVNAHTDLSLTSFADYPHDPFESADGRFSVIQWLIEVSRFKSKLSPQDQKTAIQNGLKLAQQSGTTTLGDVCRFPVAIPLYQKSGLRIVCLAEIENIQRVLAKDEFEQALALVDEIKYSQNSKVTAGLAPFSAYTLSKPMLRIVASHAQTLNIPLHLHAALSFSEMEFFYDSLGEVTSLLFSEAGWKEKIPPPHRMTPIQYLHEIGVLKAHPSLVGCIHMGPTDSALLAQAGSVRIFAPLAFEYLQVGEVNWEKVMREKIPWALGTMGKGAGGSLNPWEEMRQVLYRLEGKLSRTEVSQSLLRGATIGAAQALGLEKEVGSLVKNKKADFIVVESPQGDESLEAGLVDQVKPEKVIATFVGGEKVGILL